MRLLIFLLFAQSLHAVELERYFNGKWKRLKQPNHQLMIHPDRMKIRFCKKTKILEKIFVFDKFNEATGLHQRHYSLLVHARQDTNLHCLPMGHHTCTISVTHWDVTPDRLSLLLSCDDGDFFQVYQRRIWN